MSSRLNSNSVMKFRRRKLADRKETWLRVPTEILLLHGSSFSYGNIYSSQFRFSNRVQRWRLVSRLTSSHRKRIYNKSHLFRDRSLLVFDFLFNPQASNKHTKTVMIGDNLIENQKFLLKFIGRTKILVLEWYSG